MKRERVGREIEFFRYAAAGSPEGPAFTSSRKTSSRLSCQA